MKPTLALVVGSLVSVGVSAAEQRNVRSLLSIPEPLSPIPFNCDTCKAGYSDGCNSCKCLDGQEVDCTDHVCVWEGIPSCLCDNETNECPNGDIVTKDPRNNCQFPTCPPIDIACTDDVKQCPDGSYVSRDPKNRCAFFPCPPIDIACTDDVKQCPDGSYVSRDPKNRCAFFPCPPIDIACTDDARQCPDGSFVSRDPKNGCEFFPCPPVFCTADVKQCPDGSYVSRDPKNKCEFFPCPSQCCEEPKPSVQECGRSGCHCCSDGQWLLGNSGPTVTSEVACGRFELEPSKSCDIIACPRDVKVCPDGTTVSRNPKLNCEFDPCPIVKPVKCCADPKPLPWQCGRSGCHCCSDGEWLLGNSGPTVTQKEACARVLLLPSKPCRPACLTCKSNKWTDGCNTCWCSHGQPACTKRYCDPSQLLPEPECL